MQARSGLLRNAFIRDFPSDPTAALVFPMVKCESGKRIITGILEFATWHPSIWLGSYQAVRFGQVNTSAYKICELGRACACAVALVHPATIAGKDSPRVAQTKSNGCSLAYVQSATPMSPCKLTHRLGDDRPLTQPRLRNLRT